MSAATPHDHYEELVVGLALSTLEPQDEQELMRHLPTCPTCERELRAHRAALGQLSTLDDGPEPPPALWAGIREAVESRSPTAFSPPAPRASVEQAPPAVVDLQAARQRRARRALPRAARWTAAAACLALVLGLGAWSLALRHDLGQRGATADRYAAAMRTLESGPARTVPLTGMNGRVQATAVVRPDAVSLVVDGLRPNDTATSTYVLWGQSGSAAPTALGSFDVRGEDVQVVRDLSLPGAPRAPELLLITREPGRTAPAATKQPALATGRAT